MKKALVPILFCSLLLALSACVSQPGGSPSGTPADGQFSATPATTTPSTTDVPACPDGIVLPAGVDPQLVCGNTPVSTIVLPNFKIVSLDMIWNGFQTSDHNVACSWYEGGTVVCKAVKMNVAYPDDPRNAGADIDCQRGLSVDDSTSGTTCNGGVMALDEIPGLAAAPILEAGQIVLSTDYPYPWSAADTPVDPVACSAETNGVTCWNTVTSHGFKISANLAVLW